MPSPKEIYNQVKEAEAKIDQAQADFDVMEKRLGEIEEENPEFRDSQLVEFRGFQISRKEVRFIEEIEKQTGDLTIGNRGIMISNKRIHIQDNKIRGLYLFNTQLKEITQPLPESLKVLNLSSTSIKELTQPLPDGLKVLNLSNTSIKELTQPLPDGLEVLNLSSTSIKELTQPLPDGLKVLNLSSTSIKELTQPLPDGLEMFNFSFTSIKELTQQLPDGLKRLDLYNTPLTTDPLYKDNLEDLEIRADAISGIIFNC